MIGKDVLKLLSSSRDISTIRILDCGTGYSAKILHFVLDRIPFREK